MGRYSGKSCRLSVMLSMTATFFLVEIIVGYVTNSMALVADSFHMLSDVVSLLVGFFAVRIARKKTHKNTFGWVRAEVMGAMINAVFLVALCFTIMVESLKRLLEIERIDNPKLILVVGSVGLLVNLIGLALFREQGSKPSKKSQSGSGSGSKHGHSDVESDHSNPEVHAIKVELSDASSNEHVTSIVTVDGGIHDDEEADGNPKMVSSAQLNMRAVFLHVMGDALGSVIVIISALIIWFAEGDWRYYVDPAMSLAMVTIILSTSMPLLKESTLILLQTPPSHLNVREIQSKLLDKVSGVLAVHEFHVWRLAGNKIIASAHIQCRSLDDYMDVASQVKEFLHNEGIHSTTIQPEFVEFTELDDDNQCILECLPEKCAKRTCCGHRKKPPVVCNGISVGQEYISKSEPPPGVKPTVVTLPSLYSLVPILRSV